MNTPWIITWLYKKYNETDGPGVELSPVMPPGSLAKSDTSNLVKAEACFDAGRVLIREERYVEAESELREAIKLKPDWAGAFAKLGEALTGQGKYDEAEKAYREAVRIDPSDEFSHRGVIVVSMMKAVNKMKK